MLALNSVSYLPWSVFAGSRIGSYKIWISQMDYDNIWDFKTILDSKKISYVSINGQNYRMDIVANIHYGFVGMAAGFSPNELYAGAGVAHYFRGDRETGRWWSFFDDPADTIAINLGINLWKSSRTDLSVNQFEAYVQAYTDSGLFDGYLIGP